MELEHLIVCCRFNNIGRNYAYKHVFGFIFAAISRSTVEKRSCSIPEGLISGNGPWNPTSVLEYTALVLFVQNSGHPAEQTQTCKICKHQLQVHFKTNENV